MIGAKIKEQRKLHGWTQKELAEKVGVTKQSISNWENETIKPSIEMFVELAKVFDVTTDYLFGLDCKKLVDFTELDEDEAVFMRQMAAYIVRGKK